MAGSTNFEAWGRRHAWLLEERAFVAIDFETTGLRYLKHEIIEIGACRVIPGAEPRFQVGGCLVRPTRKLSPRIVELTGISNEEVFDLGAERKRALTGLLDFIGDDPIVAYNAPFDLGFLNYECHRLSVPIAKRGGYACALTAARKVFSYLDNHKLATVAAHLGLDLTRPHRAREDAKRAAIIYLVARAGIPRRPSAAA